MRALLLLAFVACVNRSTTHRELLLDIPPGASASSSGVSLEPPPPEAWSPRERPPGPGPTCDRIGGSSEHFTTTAGIDPPVACGGSFWVRVHAPPGGRRKLDYRAKGQPLTPTTCDVATADPVACPTVTVDVFGMAVLAALAGALNKTSVLGAEGFGLGACGNFQGGLDQWNLSSRIHDWRDADEAVHIVRSELRRWNIGDSYGISLMPVLCATPL